MKKLILIRHCQSKQQSGEEEIKYRNDSPLSKQGRTQAQLLADHFKDEKIDLILTSLCLRSQQTAEILNKKREVPVFSSMALNEYFLRDDGSGVETTEQGLARSLGFINQFRPYYENIAVVGHNSILRTLLMDSLHIRFEELDNYFSKTGEGYTLRFDWEEGDKTWQIIDSFTPELADKY